MTAKPELINKEDNEVQQKTTKQAKEFAVIEDLFSLGYATSDDITIFKDEKEDIKINIRVRTLLPAEIRDIFEQTFRYDSPIGIKVTEEIETLARCIVTINGMPLVLPQNEKEDLANILGTVEPTPLQQSRYILTHKIKSVSVLDLMYEAYEEFKSQIEHSFKDLKKNLKKSPQQSK